MHTPKRMGKKRSPELVFELPAHSTEWSGRQGGPVGRPPGRPWPPFGPALAALRAAACSEGLARAALRPGLAPAWRPFGQAWPPLGAKERRPGARRRDAANGSSPLQL